MIFNSVIKGLKKNLIIKKTVVTFNFNNYFIYSLF